MKLAVLCIVLAGGHAAARATGPAAFRFACRLGARTARVDTEGRDLVYRYGPAGAPDMTLRGGASGGHVFFRRDEGMRSESRQLRFVNGAYSYAFVSLFIAPSLSGEAGEDDVRFFVLRGDTVLRMQRCRGAGSFTDSKQLDALPRDTMRPLAD